MNKVMIDARELLNNLGLTYNVTHTTVEHDLRLKIWNTLEATNIFANQIQHTHA